jgi:hypothetical protein
MSPEAIVAIIGGLLAIAGLSYFVGRKVPKRLKAVHYTRKWRELQKLCAKKETWPDAIKSADNMLDEVMRKKRKPGNSMGERLVSSQKYFTNNDAVWKAHKLVKHIEHSDKSKLKEQDIKESLVAFRQALRDLGAFK